MSPGRRRAWWAAPSSLQETRIIAVIAHRVIRHARAILVLSALLGVLSIAGAGLLTGSLSSTGFEDPSSESVAARDRVEAAAQVSPGPGIIVLVDLPGEVSAPASRARLAEVEAALEDEREIALVQGPLDPQGRTQVSRDGRLAYVVGRFRPGDDDPRMEAAARVQQRFADADHIRVGGPAAVADQVTSQIKRDLTRSELIALPLLFVLALWVFRGAVAAALMPLLGGLVISSAFFAVGLVNTVVTMSVFSVNLIVAIGLGLAVDYSLLMITRFRQELAAGADRAHALTVTMRTAGVSVVFSAVTVAAALAGLMLFPINFLFSMGLGGMMVALIAGLAAVLPLPAALWLLGPRINALAPRRWQRASEESHTTSGGWYRLSSAVLRRPLRVALVTGAVLAVVATPALRMHFVPVDATVMGSSSAARQVQEALETRFERDSGGATSVAFSTAGVAGPRRAVEACAAAMREVAHVRAVTPPRRIGGDVWSLDVLPAVPSLSDAGVQMVRDLREVPCDADPLMGGIAADFIDQRAAIVAGLPASVGVVSLVTVVALFLMTGSVVLPLKAIILNVLSIGAAIGVMVWVFQDGAGEGLLGFDARGGIGLTQPVLLGAVAFGLSTDYAVFLLSRIRELRLAGRSNDVAVAEGLQYTGRVITAAALLFAVAVSTFAASGVVVLKEIGIGLAVSVLIDASIVRALLVPALMGVLGEWNWWAPRWLRRVHARVGISESG